MYKYINIYYIYNELFFVLIKKLIKKQRTPSVLGRSAGFVPCSYLAENGWTK